MSYSTAYQKRRLFDLARGIEHTYIDPEPVTRHVHRLLERGMTARSIATIAGVSPSTILRFRDRQYPHAQRTTAAKILAVQPRLTYRPGTRCRVPAIGARRRIQALLALGWSHELITAELPPGARSRVILHRAGESMSSELHAVIRDVYDRLSMTPGPSDIARDRAARNGYVPPLAWDDDTIDDPDAHPHVVTRAQPWILDEVAIERAMSGGRVELTRPERQVVVERLAAKGMSDRAISDLVGVTERTVYRDRQERGIESRWVAA